MNIYINFYINFHLNKYRIINYMRIVVTGASGMVGNYLKKIAEKNYKSHDFIYLNRSKNNKYTLDLTNRKNVMEFFEKENFDFIIHLAANVGGLFKNLKNNTKIFSDNIKMNENILEACHKNNINRGIFCLSSCIFPHNPSKFPMTEQMILESEPHYSNRGYAYAKRMLYIQCQNYNKDFNKEYICVAPVNMYGRYDNFNLENGHFIPSIIHRFYNEKNNDKLIAYGTGKPLRQLLYAEDFSVIICKLLFNSSLTNNNDLINISNSNEFSIKYYIEKIAEIMNIDKSKIIWDTTKSDGCLRKTVDNSILKKIFPNYQFTSLENGLKITYEWFIENYNSCRK